MTVIATASTVDAIGFNCDFDFYQLPLGIGNLYACVPKVFSEETKTLDRVEGVHKKDYTHHDVEFLFVLIQNIDFVPQGIDNFFPNLKAMNFYGNNIFSISARDLRPFPRLEYLALYNNELESLDGDLFMYTPRLSYIHLGANKLQHIGKGLVTDLDRLEYLNLDENICIDENANTHDEVKTLATQLSLECPPLGEATSAERDEFVKFWENIEEALIQVVKLLNEKIEEQKSNIDLLIDSTFLMNKGNEKIVQRINAVEKALNKVEKNQKEISSKMHEQTCQPWSFQTQAS